MRIEKLMGLLRGCGPPMSVQNDHDHHSDYGPGQLVLFGAAAIVLLVFAWIVVA